MLENGNVVPNPDADDDTKHEISQIVAYFDSRDSTADLKFIDAEFERSEMEEIFGFESFYINKYPRDEHSFIYGDHEKTRVLDVSGYDYFAEIYSHGEKLEFEVDGAQFEIITENSGDYYLTISADGGEIYSISMYDMLMPWFEEYGGSDEEGEYIFTDETDAVSVKMIILHAEYNVQDTSYLFYDIKLMFSIK